MASATVSAGALEAVDANHATARLGHAAMTFIKVDLPAPFSPTRPITSPADTAQGSRGQRDHAGIDLADVDEFEEGIGHGRNSRKKLRRRSGTDHAGKREPARSCASARFSREGLTCPSSASCWP
jgi:hypothetical protein